MTENAMLRKVLFILALLLVTGISQAWSATYYIDPNGSDTQGNGSQTNPWYSLSNACSKVRTSGDTIYIRAGSYTDNNPCNLAVGVNITGAGKDLVTIRSSYAGWYLSGTSTSLTNGNHTISGFILDGNSRHLRSGMQFRNRNNITIRDANFRHIADRAIDISVTSSADNPPSAYATGILLYNLNIYACASHYTSDNSFGAIHINGTRGARLFNLIIDESTTTGQAIKGVYGWHSGLKIYNNKFTVGKYGATNGCIIEIWNMMDDSEIYNNVFNNGMVSFVSGNKNNGTYSFTFHNNILNNSTNNEFSTDDIVIHNNFFNGSADIDGPVGGIAIWQTHRDAATDLRNITIRNNVILNAGNAGIYVTDKGRSTFFSDINIYNNVIDNVKNTRWEGTGIVLNPKGGSTWQRFNVKNNIIMNNDGAGIRATGSTLSSIKSIQVTRNCFYGNKGGDIYLNGTSSPSVYSNLYTSPGIQWSGLKPTPYYFPANSTANIVDAGTNVGLPFSGSAPDIGAYEYNGVTISPPTGLKILSTP
jgi:hypothetical protein